MRGWMNALARLMLQVENYPKLEGSRKYGDLLEALKGAEYQIAVARRKYNEAVEHYNAGIDLFPNNIVASVTRLGKIDAYFQTPAI
jgi:LemA protein